MMRLFGQNIRTIGKRHDALLVNNQTVATNLVHVQLTCQQVPSWSGGAPKVVDKVLVYSNTIPNAMLTVTEIVRGHWGWEASVVPRLSHGSRVYCQGDGRIGRVIRSHFPHVEADVDGSVHTFHRGHLECMVPASLERLLNKVRLP